MITAKTSKHLDYSNRSGTKHDLQLLLRKIISLNCPPKETAILASGGLDSTALAYCARELQPTLFFAAIEHPWCQIYNHIAIQTCRQISRYMGLKFHIIPITRKQYALQFNNVIRLMAQPIADPDLPAVAHLANEIRSHGFSHLLSGIGSDEVFNLNSARLQTYFRKATKDIIPIHQSIARDQQLNFVFPFLHKLLMSYNQQTSPAARRNKQPLLDLLKSTPLYAPMLQRAPQHSIIPADFLAPFFKQAKICLNPIKKQACIAKLFKYHWHVAHDD